MTYSSSVRAPAESSGDTAPQQLGRADHSARHAAPVLIAFLILLNLIPPRLVLPGLGAAGRPAAVFSLGLLAWWLLSRLLPQNEPTTTVLIRATLYIYMMVFLASMLAGLDRGLPGIELRSMDRLLLVTLGLVGVVLVAIDGLPTTDAIERVLSWAVGLGAIGAIVGIIQFQFNFDPTSRLSLPGLQLNSDISAIETRGADGYARVRGLALHPISFGVVLATLLPISIHLAMFGESRRRWRWFQAILLGAAIPLSISRSGIVALAVGMSVYALIWSWKQRFRALAALVAAALAFQAITPGLLGTIRSLFANIGTDNAVSGRTEDFGATASFIRQRPWLGRGPGTFLPERYQLLDNEYLGTLIERGWIGLAALTLVLFIAGATTIWLVRHSPSSRLRSLACALGASIAVAVAVLGTFDAFSFPIYAGLLFLNIGCIGALYKVESVARSGDRSIATS